MADGYQVASFDEMRHPKWPRWVTIRGKLDIRAFGINAWDPNEDGTIIPKHTEEDLGHEELYIVTKGHAAFTVGGEELDAPAGTAVFIRDPKLEREATAKDPETTVLSIGGWAGRAFEPSQWEADYLAEAE